MWTIQSITKTEDANVRVVVAQDADGNSVSVRYNVNEDSTVLAQRIDEAFAALYAEQQELEALKAELGA